MQITHSQQSFRRSAAVEFRQVVYGLHGRSFNIPRRVATVESCAAIQASRWDANAMAVRVQAVNDLPKFSRLYRDEEFVTIAP